jgi:hypothetical protein
MLTYVNKLNIKSQNGENFFYVHDVGILFSEQIMRIVNLYLQSKNINITKQNNKCFIKSFLSVLAYYEHTTVDNIIENFFKSNKRKYDNKNITYCINQIFYEYNSNDCDYGMLLLKESGIIDKYINKYNLIIYSQKTYNGQFIKKICKHITGSIDIYLYCAIFNNEHYQFMLNNEKHLLFQQKKSKNNIEYNLSDIHHKNYYTYENNNKHHEKSEQEQFSFFYDTSFNKHY